MGDVGNPAAACLAARFEGGVASTLKLNCQSRAVRRDAFESRDILYGRPSVRRLVAAFHAVGVRRPATGAGRHDQQQRRASTGAETTMPSLPLLTTQKDADMHVPGAGVGRRFRRCRAMIPP
ncbi:hypothetical protein DSL92_01870 [Billgrantia gudaonensis]|uniref:Uncharacterized protein n=1 Tax=Billgrantia gudaonensis TaxID=376427 RepID=A0A3S0VT55_9GAMM|nr:hypothetical protein DSL92_01870 [Halomonas gudaonensis]